MDRLAFAFAFGFGVAGAGGFFTVVVVAGFGVGLSVLVLLAGVVAVIFPFVPPVWCDLCATACATEMTMTQMTRLTTALIITVAMKEWTLSSSTSWNHSQKPRLAVEEAAGALFLITAAAWSPLFWSARSSSHRA